MTADRNPVHLLAGGRSSMARRGTNLLLQGALQLDGTARPSVAYIGAASGDNAMFRAMIARELRKAGAGDVKLAPMCGYRADPRKAMRVIEDCRIVFVSGGDVEEGMNVLEKKGMTDFLRNQYQEGKPFFGLSAGSIMLSNSWLRWGDPEIDSSAELFPCLGIARIYCDTHGEEDGWEELQVLAQLIPAGSIGYGIPSGTALAAYPDGSVRALGGAAPRFARKGKAVTQIESLKADS